MFSKSRKRIVAAMTGSLTLLLLVTLAVIYGTSFLEIRHQNSEMLERYVALYSLENQPGDAFPERPPDHEEPSQTGEPIYALSSFYSVALSAEGEVIALDRGTHGIYTEGELIETAREILAHGENTGHKNTLQYIAEHRQEYTLVAFMDSTVSDHTLNTLLRNTLIAGGAAIAILFGLSILLARRIVHPLEENDRRQRQFISDAGHELKTPVSVMSANAELLQREIGENQWLSNILYENERMGQLVTQLLELSRAEKEQIPMESIDLSHLVTGELLPFESVAFERGLRIESDIAEGVAVTGNSPQLRQLTAILLDNAIQYCEGGEEIEISLVKKHHNAVLRVANSASELSAEHLAHLFDRFYRTDEARGDDGHYGLGLSIAKAITEAHKGSISAAYEGGKAVFWVELPA